MKYRAVAIGQMNDEHQVQIYGQHIGEIQRWAKEVSVARKCTVEIWERTETRIETVDLRAQ